MASGILLLICVWTSFFSGISEHSSFTPHFSPYHFISCTICSLVCFTFDPPFFPLSTSSPPACVYFLLPSSISSFSSLNKAATATGLIPYAVQILIISYTLRAQTCWALIIRAAAFICIFIARERRRFIMFRWRRSLKSVWTISWNEGPAAMATIWWGRQGYLKEFSCCSRSRQHRAGPGEKTKKTGKKEGTIGKEM